MPTVTARIGKWKCEMNGGAERLKQEIVSPSALILLHFFSDAMKYYRKIRAFSCDIEFTRNASDALHVICVKEKT